VKIIWAVGTDNAPDVKVFTKAEIVHRHDEWKGGNDVAYLENAT